MQQQLFRFCTTNETNGSIPSNYPVLKEASNEVITTTSPSQRSAATTIFSEDFDGGIGDFTVYTDPDHQFHGNTTVGHVGQYQTATHQLPLETDG